MLPRHVQSSARAVDLLSPKLFPALAFLGVKSTDYTFFGTTSTKSLDETPWFATLPLSLRESFQRLDLNFHCLASGCACTHFVKLFCILTFLQKPVTDSQ